MLLLPRLSVAVHNIEVARIRSRGRSRKRNGTTVMMAMKRDAAGITRMIIATVEVWALGSGISVSRVCKPGCWQV